jgi:hypothetical protein
MEKEIALLKKIKNKVFENRPVLRDGRGPRTTVSCISCVEN